MGFARSATDELQLADQLVEVLVLAKAQPDGAACQAHADPPRWQRRLRSLRGLIVGAAGWPDTVLLCGIGDLEPDPFPALRLLHAPVAREDRHDGKTPPCRGFIFEQELARILGTRKAGSRNHRLYRHRTVVFDAHPHHILEQPQVDVHEGACTVQRRVPR